MQRLPGLNVSETREGGISVDSEHPRTRGGWLVLPRCEYLHQLVNDLDGEALAETGQDRNFEIYQSLYLESKSRTCTWL